MIGNCFEVQHRELKNSTSIACNIALKAETAYPKQRTSLSPYLGKDYRIRKRYVNLDWLSSNPLKSLGLTRSSISDLFSVLLDHLIRSRQHIRWNRQAHLLGCFQIDDELELRRLLDGQVGRLGAF
jgi:hypothetical protein